MKKNTTSHHIQRFIPSWERWTTSAGRAVQVLREGRMSAPRTTNYRILKRMTQFEWREYTPSESVTDTEGCILILPSPRISSELFDVSPELSVIRWFTTQGFSIWMPSHSMELLDRTAWSKEIYTSVSELVQTVTVPIHVIGYAESIPIAAQIEQFVPHNTIQSILLLGHHSSMTQTEKGSTSSWGEYLLSFAQRHAAAIQDLQKLQGTNEQDLLPHSDVASQEINHILRLLRLYPSNETTDSKRAFDPPNSWPQRLVRHWLQRWTRSSLSVDNSAHIQQHSSCPILHIRGVHEQPINLSSLKIPTTSKVYTVEVDSGHFGLLIGAYAMTEIWPQVLHWIHWSQKHKQDGRSFTPMKPNSNETQKESDIQLSSSAQKETKNSVFPIQKLYDMTTDIVDTAWQRIGEVSLDMGSLIDSMRWQLPRLAKLLHVHPQTDMSISLALYEQARAVPHTFIFNTGMYPSWTYAMAYAYVQELIYSFEEEGIGKDSFVVLALSDAASTLLFATALNQLGAVSVLLSQTALPDTDLPLFQSAIIDDRSPSWFVHAHEKKCIHAPRQRKRMYSFIPSFAISPALPDPASNQPHRRASAHPGKAGDLALYMYTIHGTQTQLTPISNQRWVLTALSTAAICGLTQKDNVYTPLSHAHPFGFLCAASGSMLSGAMLVQKTFYPSSFIQELKRHSISVIWSLGRHTQHSLHCLIESSETVPSLRLIAGNGIHPKLHKKWLKEVSKQTFSYVHVRGFSETHTLFVQFETQPSGNQGRPLLGHTSNAMHVQFDFETKTYTTDAKGHYVPCAQHDAKGILFLRKKPDSLPQTAELHNVRYDVFSKDDVWYDTREVWSLNSKGEYRFYGHLDDMIVAQGKPQSTLFVDRILQEQPCIRDVKTFLCTSEKDTYTISVIQLQPGFYLSSESLVELLHQRCSTLLLPRWLLLYTQLPYGEDGEISLRHIHYNIEDDPMCIAWLRLDLHASTYTEETRDRFLEQWIT